MQGGAVEIIDHYAVKCDSRKLSDCSEPLQPARPPRKFGEAVISSTPVSRKASGSLDSSPVKPSRKLSQSSASRDFSASSDNVSLRTPKKVSFSDDLPMSNASAASKQSRLHGSDGADTDDDDDDDDDTSSRKSIEQTIQMASQRLKAMYSGSHGDTDRSSSDSAEFDASISTTIATQTANELTMADMFPNSRKVSLHSERSFDMGAVATLKPGTESATTQITTETEGELLGTVLDQFIDSERRSSTTSVRSN